MSDTQRISSLTQLAIYTLQVMQELAIMSSLIYLPEATGHLISHSSRNNKQTLNEHPNDTEFCVVLTALSSKAVFLSMLDSQKNDL